MSQTFSWTIGYTENTGTNVGLGSGTSAAGNLLDQSKSPLLLPRDFALLPNSSEIDLSQGDMRFTTGVESIGQDVRIRLGWWLGEWQQDLSLGVDYPGRVFIKNPDPDGIKGMFRDAASGAAGIGKITSVTADVRSSDRSLAATLSANTDYGAFSLAISNQTSSKST